jgi:hypothetical protein
MAYFAHLGKAFDFGAHVFGAQSFGRIDGGDIQLGKLIPALAGRAALKQQSLVLGGMVADLLNHASTSARVSISARVFISVEHSSMESASSG